MTNAAKAKGSHWERLVSEMLKAAGLHNDRMPAGARLDRGDISLKRYRCPWCIHSSDVPKYCHYDEVSYVDSQAA